MKYTLIDYTANKETVTVGTCELCMGTRSMTNQSFHFQDENGGVHIIPGHMWVWGDIFEVYIENIPHFANWVSHTDIEPPYEGECGYDYKWLEDIVFKYDEMLNKNR